MKITRWCKGLLSAFMVSATIWSVGEALATDYIREPIVGEEALSYPNNLIYAWNIDKTDGRDMRCTGMIIGNGKFLSAGHCVTNSEGVYGSWTSASTETNDTHPLEMKMYKKNVFVKSPFRVMPGYEGFEDLKNDVSITNITTPTQLNVDTSSVQIVIYRNLYSLIGQTVNTAGYSSHLYSDFTKTSGEVLAVEEDGTLTVDMFVIRENSGSPVFLNGQLIGVLTAIADTPECREFSICTKATVTPFTPEIKQNLFDKNGVNSIIID